jgi:hypothetical protein
MKKLAKLDIYFYDDLQKAIKKYEEYLLNQV